MNYHIIRKIRVNVVSESSARFDTDNKRIEGPRHSLPVFRKWCPNDGKEHFISILTDANHAPIGVNTVSIGTLTSSLVHPREVLRPAIVMGAAACIIGHNHPSGDVSPSSEDRETTRRLKEAMLIMGISLLDHVIFTHGSEAYHSFREAGNLS